MVQSSSGWMSATSGPRPDLTTFDHSSMSGPTSVSGRAISIFTPMALATWWAVSMRCWSPISTLAPESSRANFISSSVHHALNDTLTAPTEMIAANEMIHSG